MNCQMTEEETDAYKQERQTTNERVKKKAGKQQREEVIKAWREKLLNSIIINLKNYVKSLFLSEIMQELVPIENTNWLANFFIF